MPQKNKVYIGLATVAVLAVVAVFVFYWARSQFSVSASTLPLAAEPPKLTLVVGQKSTLNISGGHLPYGGYITNNSDVATVDSWHNQSVVSADAKPPFILNVGALAPGQTTIKVWDGVGAMVEVPILVESSADIATSAEEGEKRLPLVSTTTEAVFVPELVQLKVGEEQEATVALGELSAQFSGIINSNSAIASTVWFGATESEGVVSLTLKVKAVGKGSAQLALIHKGGEQLVLPVYVE